MKYKLYTCGDWEEWKLVEGIEADSFEEAWALAEEYLQKLGPAHWVSIRLEKRYEELST